MSHDFFSQFYQVHRLCTRKSLMNYKLRARPYRKLRTSFDTVMLRARYGFLYIHIYVEEGE